MDVREHDLPGVGKKFACTTADGDRVSVVIHNTGARELYLFERGEDIPHAAVRLEDAEARKLGAILGGAYFQPATAESMEMVLGQLSVEWMKVEQVSPLAGKSLAAAAVRERTGASVIAVLRDGTAIPNPHPDLAIAPGDTLMVIGDREQVGRFGALLRGTGPA
ncbi:MAG TPA: cation:proton antiporter regulatory subunit [Longimicrobiaceae bacterium]|nr:cation:proton antiporter regulatory subunit [Longimicrobiaceae bacterium]